MAVWKAWRYGFRSAAGRQMNATRLAAIPLIILITSAAACASGLSHPVQDSRNGYGDAVITADQIDDEHAANAWELLRHMVPRYSYVEDKSGRAVAITGHRGRSSISVAGSESAVVVLDGTRLVSLEVLQTMPPGSIGRIEVQSGMRGTKKEGTNATAGVIYIYSRSG